MNACFSALVAACLAMGAALPSYAHAEDLSAGAPFTSSQNTPTTQPPANQSGNWQPDATSSETRAQVYQDLVHAQQDGQISYLDRTVYAHH
ncbi:DUF4148 domain-containing protein [Paraburkholderia solisilvae]|uniref:DUF4148 domain-containing protein n=1 Tax=Paraburkholderia solisilvae TaxID=624376 RepID=A0A6J5E3I7_9BURK|nr:DUF4148 domain-containing protein [Paraburkholderia solisilvae]CAB3760547.1 hypothetical protein LMG29739_03422 [Paraburkholderia solisilvae]